MRRDYGVSTIILESGERFALLIDRSSGLPHPDVCDYALTFLRDGSYRTAENFVGALAILHEWADHRGINLSERVGTGNLLTADETTALAEALWERAPGSRDPKTTPTSVVGQTHGTRVDSVIAYLRHRKDQTLSKLRHDDPKIGSVNGRFENIREQLHALKGQSKSIPRGSLTEDQCLRLFEIVRPGSPENPFQKATQLRNFCLLLAYYELGVRRSELLVLKGPHLDLGRRPSIKVVYTPNDPRDGRKKQPRVKTSSRILPISLILRSALEKYLRERLSNPTTRRAAEKNPFLFISSSSGNELSGSAVDDIFALLRRRFKADFPDSFAAHHLRRSWNYRFSNSCKAAGVTEDKKDTNGVELSEHIRNYLMGWSKTSNQSSNYNAAFIQEQAFNILLHMQDRMTGILL